MIQASVSHAFSEDNGDVSINWWLILLSKILLLQGARNVMGENLKFVWAKFSALS